MAPESAKLGSFGRKYCARGGAKGIPLAAEAPMNTRVPFFEFLLAQTGSIEAHGLRSFSATIERWSVGAMALSPLSGRALELAGRVASCNVAIQAGFADIDTLA
jgi:hypothetical protein